MHDRDNTSLNEGTLNKTKRTYKSTPPRQDGKARRLDYDIQNNNNSTILLPPNLGGSQNDGNKPQVVMESPLPAMKSLFMSPTQ